ncbi:YtxH domain-containing protein [Bacillus sp. J33]|uniref:YtxH domain-containing protein n=1 Tax=Bacillus sp. J33 TaxID=935836 RepID=UPI00047DB528|nr:YtxH domain-containing protein [Bacillus sp. J33]
MGKSLFWKGVLYGAIAGGALSLLDKTTRETVTANVKKTSSDVGYYLKNPKEAVTQVQEVSNKVRTAIEQVSEDVAFITGTVEELKEMAPEVTEIVQNTKQAFAEIKPKGSSGMPQESAEETDRVPH